MGQFLLGVDYFLKIAMVLEIISYHAIALLEILVDYAGDKQLPC